MVKEARKDGLGMGEGLGVNSSLLAGVFQNSFKTTVRIEEGENGNNRSKRARTRIFLRGAGTGSVVLAPLPKQAFFFKARLVSGNVLL
jgi:hypothetical protein